jgi:uncharacterized protein YdhG (YjbR/CyaY superfamily)
MSVIDDYLAKVSLPERSELERIRQLVKEAVPDAKELISYGMPGFKYKGKYLIAFAEFKHHLSIFPGASAVETLSDQLGDFKTSKGTVQFTLDHPLPDEIIHKMLQTRISEITKS